MIALIVIAIALLYLAGGSWTFGYICGHSAATGTGNYDRNPSWYYRDAMSGFGAAAWPVYLLFKIVLGHGIWLLVHKGEATADLHAKQRRIRVDEENRLRVEAEQAHQELDEELSSSKQPCCALGLKGHL